MSTRCQSACWTRSPPPAAPRACAIAVAKITTRSTIAAPMIVPSAIRNVILRKGSVGCSQPIDTKNGFSAWLSSPPTSAGMPMRAPTIMPAPNVDALKPVAASVATLSVASPLAMPTPMPLPSLPIERRSSTGSVSARRMVATASPDG